MLESCLCHMDEDANEHGMTLGEPVLSSTILFAILL